MELAYTVISHFWFVHENLEAAEFVLMSNRNQACIEDEGAYYLCGWNTYLLSYIVTFTTAVCRSFSLSLFVRLQSCPVFSALGYS